MGQTCQDSDMHQISDGRIAVIATLFAVFAVAACDGPKETAGREQDRMSAAANGQEARDGANAMLGAQQDRLDEAARKVRDAQADALERQADKLRTDADVSADRLEDQARSVRDAAK